MYTTTNYGFNIVEGTDMVNPLTQLNPNFTALDTDLKTVSDATVDNATCIKTGTVHAVTRSNTDAKIFKFTATGDWNTGDTMTVDGTLVSVYVSDGTAPSNNCYVINTEVLAAIQGTRVTLYVNSGDASNIYFDDTSVSYTANNVQTALEAASTAVGTEYSSGVSVKTKLDEKNGISLFGTYTKSAGVESGYYPTDKPFIATVYGSGNVASMFCSDRTYLGKFLYLDSTHRIYFNNAGAFGMGDVETGTTVIIYQIN